MSREVVFNERGTDLDLVILPMIGTKDLGGKDIILFIRDSPHVGGATTRGAITGLRQPTTEEVGFR